MSSRQLWRISINQSINHSQHRSCLRGISTLSCVRHRQSTELVTHSSSFNRSIQHANHQSNHQSNNQISNQSCQPARFAHFSMGPNETETHRQIISLPPYIQAVELAEMLNVTLPKFSAQCRFSFPEWWPRELTRKRIKKAAYNSVKALIFNFDESSAIAKMYGRQPHLQIMTGSDLTRTPAPLIYQRPPVIALLGHKDHGKTTLLDSLRGTRIADREEFGITQDTYSHTVTLDRDTDQSERQSINQSPAGQRRTFTFLDTPGHHSFSEMRATAASHADMCMLVVAADEGLLDQTFECLNIVTELKMPVLIVITKTDAPNARPDRIRATLKKLGAKLLSADQPSVSTKGSIVAVEVSAHQKINLDVLRKALFDCSSLLDLNVDLNDIPQGSVVESWREEKGRGHVVKVMIKSGVLRVNDYFLSDMSWGRVKAMRDCKGNAVTEVRPGEPVEIMGVDGLPVPGSDFIVCSKQGAESMVHVRRLEHEYPNQARLLDHNAPTMEADPSEDYSHIEGKKISKTARGRLMDAVMKEHQPKRHFENPKSKSSPPTIWDIPKFIEKGVEYEALPIVLKTNNVGSLRMLHDSIDLINSKHGSELINVVDATVGAVTKSDIQYAAAWECPIYCFRAEPAGRREKEMMHKEKVKTIEYRHHEHLIEDLWKHMNQLHEKRKLQAEQSPIEPIEMSELSKTKGLKIHSVQESLLALSNDEYDEDEFDIDDENYDDAQPDDWRQYVDSNDVQFETKQNNHQ